MEILLNTTAYTQNINAERHMKLKQSQGIKKIMIQYLIRLPLACYPILSVCPCYLLHGWLLFLLFFVLSSSPFERMMTMFLLIVSFRISMFTKWKTFSIRFELGCGKVCRIQRLQFLRTLWGIGAPILEKPLCSWVGAPYNMEEKCSRAISAIIPRDNLPKYYSHSITLLL